MRVFIETSVEAEIYLPLSVENKNLNSFNFELWITTSMEWFVFVCCRAETLTCL